MISVFGIVLITLHAVTYWMSPELYQSFLNQLLGRYADQHAPMAEMAANPSNVTVLIFIRNIGELFLGDEYWKISVPIGFLLVGFSYYLWQKAIKNETDRLVRVCWCFLLLTLWLPRFKPYSLVMSCLCLIPILQKKSRVLAIGLLVLSIFHRTINGDKENPFWDYFANNTAIYAYLIILFVLAKAKDKQLHA
jgi:hypothetical protein